MDNKEQAKLLTALQKGTVQVTFRKIDTGEIVNDELVRKAYLYLLLHYLV